MIQIIRNNINMN